MNSNQLKGFDQILNVAALFVGDNEIAMLPSQSILPNLEFLVVSGNPCAKTFPENRSIFALPKMKMFNGTIITNQIHARVDKRLSGVLFPEDLSKLLQPKQTDLNFSGKEMKDVNCLRSDSPSDLNLSNN
jgi:hypothetical protein